MFTGYNQYRTSTASTSRSRLPNNLGTAAMIKTPEKLGFFVEDPIVQIERNLCVHPLAGLLWEGTFENISWKKPDQRVFSWGAHNFTAHIRCFFSIRGRHLQTVQTLHVTFSRAHLAQEQAGTCLTLCRDNTIILTRHVIIVDPDLDATSTTSTIRRTTLTTWCT